MSQEITKFRNEVEDRFKKLESLFSSSQDPVSSHPSIKNILDDIKSYLEKFVNAVDTLHIQTVVLNSTSGAGTVTISPAGNSGPNFLPVTGNVIALYDTKITLNGDTQNAFPEKTDQTVLTRHNQLVDQMYKARTDTIVKIIDGITGALKIGTFL